MYRTPGIANIINFVRAVEPRNLALDLVLPVREQLALARKHHLPVTWLLQYAALMDPRFRFLLAGGEQDEIGVWFEVVQPLVEKAGLTWRGRFPWDWHAHVGFPVIRANRWSRDPTARRSSAPSRTVVYTGLARCVLTANVPMATGPVHHF